MGERDKVAARRGPSGPVYMTTRLNLPPSGLHAQLQEYENMIASSGCELCEMAALDSNNQEVLVFIHGRPPTMNLHMPIKPKGLQPVSSSCLYQKRKKKRIRPKSSPRMSQSQTRYNRREALKITWFDRFPCSHSWKRELTNGQYREYSATLTSTTGFCMPSLS